MCCRLSGLAHAHPYTLTMLTTLLNIWNILLVVLGFGLMILLHELGHFLAARWAGIRAPAFAIGFGHALCSWRKGMGFRIGSTEPEYLRRLKAAGEHPETGHLPGISETEYRLNWLPLGGYVRMLGQEDANPKALSAASNSFGSKPVWKRMIVVSAGVVMNLILAAVLFIIVFAAGLRDVPPVIGAVMADSPAAEAGLQAGDVVRTIDAKPANSFADLQIASALSGRDPVVFGVERASGELVEISVAPRFDERAIERDTKMIGVGPAASNRLLQSDIYSPEDELRNQFARAGLAGVGPGMQLMSVNGAPLESVVAWRGQEVTTLRTLEHAVEESNGEPIELAFSDGKSERHSITITPQPELMYAPTILGESPTAFEHLLGLTPVMSVLGVQQGGRDAGLEAGDIFIRIGERSWPSLITGIAEVRAHAGRPIELVILRNGSEIVTLNPTVRRDATIGFWPGSATDHTFLGAPPQVAAINGAERPERLAASRLSPPIGAGMRILAVNDQPVDDFRSLRAALWDATREAYENESSASVTLTVGHLETDSPEVISPERLDWALTAEEIVQLHALGWQANSVLAQFMTAQMIVRASGPIDALGLGIDRTKRVLLLTYLTLQRLFSGDVRVQSLRGPVGIADIGSRVARDGFIQLLFFLALISVNLAVLNFLPMPIVDGGLFLMLVYEGITKKPVPIAVQQALTLIGLLLIGSLFIFVTFNDITRLVSGG